MTCHMTIPRPRNRLRACTRYGDLGEADGILGQIVEKRRVELAVDEAGALALQLMRHAAGAVNHHAQVWSNEATALAMACPSLKQRAPVGGGYCTTLTQSGITLKGHAAGWPQVTDSGHREAVIHRHFIGDGHVELIEDQRLREMPGELRMPLHHRHRTRAPKPSSAMGNCRRRRSEKWE
jgi:hypothetical protein